MLNRDIETDLAIVGGGGAGLMAAGTAAMLDGELRIVLIEKSPDEPCNTEIASNFIPAAGTRYQLAAGVEDSADILFHDIMKKNAGKGDEAVIAEICRRAPEAIHWLADAFGVEIEFAPELTWVGHTNRRLHAHPTRSGPPVVARLREQVARQNNVLILDYTTATGLVTDNGAVVGVTAERDRQPLHIVARRTALTTGGFGANREMVARYIPEMAGAPNIGSKTDNGDGLRWGHSAGGKLSLMSGYQGRDCIFEDGTRVTPPVLNEGGIAVDASGRRFVNERHDYSALARIYRDQPGGFAYFIWDGRIQRMVENVHVMQQAMDRGGIVRGETVEQIALAYELPRKTLQDTITRYNEGVRRGVDAFGRQALTQPLEPPWYAARITGAIAHTQGGLSVDTACRVLREDRTPVFGLYAGGNTMAGLSGDEPGGYLSGNGLLVAYVSGLIIGRHAAGSIRDA
ncbi:MAG: FAD-binding protein [Sneathiellaceae bacterium]